MICMQRRTLLAAALLALASSEAAATTWPDRSVRLIVPFPAGGTVDLVARLVALQLGRQLGVQAIVENLSGAGGVIATTRVAKAAADGYTLLFTTPNHTINPALFPKLPFDTEKDLAPLSLVAEIPELLVANADQPFKDFAGFVAFAKANPGRLNYGSAGNGTLPHVTMELLLQRLGVKVTHVPYKGAAPAMNDLLAGQVGVKMDTIATSAAQIRAGKLRPLAIASLERSPLMPDVPTLSELGVAGFKGILWMGLLAPAATDASTLSALQAAIAKLGEQPDYRKQLQEYGVEAAGGGAARFAKLIHAEIGQWSDVVQRSNIKAE